MGRHMLAVLVGVMLVLGVSTAFAEEPQLSEQAVLKAWGQAQTEVAQLTDTAKVGGMRGGQVLTDEDLDQVNAAGLRFSGITNQNGVFGLIVQTPSCHVLIGICNPQIKPASQ